ncbi:MAG: YdcF family protein [Acetobacteraceae bacterium]
MPPLALLPLPILGAAIGFRWQRTGCLIAGVGGVILMLLAMPAVGAALLVSLEQGLPLVPSLRAPPQAIVILGADFSRSAGSHPFGVGPLTLERLAAGSALYRRTHLPILVSGGKPYGGSGPSLAARMASVLAQEFRVPAIWEEQRSENTCQNGTLSASILARHNIRSIYLVTHAWHMRRALYCFHRLGMVVTAAPVRRDLAEVGISAFAPSISGWQDSYFAFHEWIGLAWYHLRY